MLNLHEKNLYYCSHSYQKYGYCIIFDQSSKMTDVGSNSTDGKGLKKLKEGSLDMGSMSDIPGDVFTEGLKKMHCNLLTCIKKCRETNTPNI